MTNEDQTGTHRAGHAPAMRRTALVCAGVVVGMVGLSFAAVPLYNLFCKATGYGGTPRIGAAPASMVSDRQVLVRFDANVAPGLGWRFEPETPVVTAKLGETKTVFYKLTNAGSGRTTGIATFNVQPDQAGAYFTKIQCFCFTEQTLEPGETIEAPVVFYVDPALDKDQDLKALSTITLSYTIFPSKNGSPVANAADGPGKPKL